MFSKANKKIRDTIYGVLCQSPLKNNQVNFGNGTAFMIAPGICATAAHVLHLDGDKKKPLHARIEVIRSPDIGGPMRVARVIAEDINRDLALIEIINPTNSSAVTLYKSKIDGGTNCGSLGFPLASVLEINKQIAFNLVERFQGAYISAFQNVRYNDNPPLDFYETDALMYGGSSGCPGYTVEEKVFGMHVATITDGKASNNSSRLAIALWIPSMDIISFADAKGIKNLNKG
jgi:V8-like Glu-specific endopeptidase